MIDAPLAARDPSAWAGVAHGVWFSFAQQIGPFATPAPAGTATVAASAFTRGFDRDTISSTGDPWLPGVVPGASAGTPIIIQPGATGNVGIIILPTHPQARPFEACSTS